MANEKNRIEHVSSKYRNVYGLSVNGKVKFIVDMKGVSRIGFETERGAAIAVDKIFIERGKAPVNILVAKK